MTMMLTGWLWMEETEACAIKSTLSTAERLKIEPSEATFFLFLSFLERGGKKVERSEIMLGEHGPKLKHPLCLLRNHYITCNFRVQRDTLRSAFISSTRRVLDVNCSCVKPWIVFQRWDESRYSDLWSPENRFDEGNDDDEEEEEEKGKKRLFSPSLWQS